MLGACASSPTPMFASALGFCSLFFGVHINPQALEATIAAVLSQHAPKAALYRQGTSHRKSHVQGKQVFLDFLLLK